MGADCVATAGLAGHPGNNRRSVESAISQKVGQLSGVGVVSGTDVCEAPHAEGIPWMQHHAGIYHRRSWILVVIGIVLLVLGAIGRPVGGRRYWY